MDPLSILNKGRAGLKAIKEAGALAHAQGAGLRAASDAVYAKRLADAGKSKQGAIDLGLYHPIGGGNKLSKSADALHATHVPDPEFVQPHVPIITPEQMVKEGAAIVPLVGDKAAAGKYLTHVGEKQFDQPVRLTGGPRYMDANVNPDNPELSAAWESGSGTVGKINSAVDLAREGNALGERPVYGMYTAGSGTNTDFNKMGVNAVLQQLPYSKMTKKSIKEFNATMKNVQPEWPGLYSDQLAEMLDQSGGMRKAFMEEAAKAGSQKMGLPDIAHTRKAIIEPELLNSQVGETGFRVARMGTNGKIIENPNIRSDYPLAMQGELAGTMPDRHSFRDMFSTNNEARRLLGRPESPDDYRSFSLATPIQYADEAWLNKLRQAHYLRDMKIKEGSYKKGGTVAKHGHTFEEDLAAAFAEVMAEHNPKPMHGEITVKTSAPVKMAKGGRASIIDALDKVSDEESIDHQIERYLNRVRLSGSGGKDAYGTNVGGSLGLDIPLSKDVTISPYLEGYTYKPTNQPIGGQVTGAGANLTMRFKDGGVSRKRNVDELIPMDRHSGMTHGTAREPTLDELQTMNPIKYGEQGLEMPMLADPYNYIGLGLGTGAAKAVGKFVAPTANRMLESHMVRSGMRPSVIKDTGGNWLHGSVEEHLSPLQQGSSAGPPIAERIAKHRQELLNPDLDEEGRRVVQGLLDSKVRNQALDKWIGGNLTNYIKKQMGTADDPVRKLAEQGIVHYKPPYPESLVDNTAQKRAKFGTSQMGVSDEAKAWENLADYSLEPSTVGNQGEIHRLFAKRRAARLSPLAKNREQLGDWKAALDPNAFPEPWMAKVDPKTKVYEMGDTTTPHALGYDHILDVLRADVTAGKIRPEQLNKISMEQAVRRTHEFNQEMAERMRNTQLKLTEGMPIHKEYPDKGYKWQELALNKQLPEGWVEEESGAFVNVSGERSTIHPNRQALQDALDYEGDVMGHCVGSYCDDVAAGRKRIFSLRDPKGDSHVTIETRPVKGNDPSRDLMVDSVVPSKLMDEYQKAFTESGEHSMHYSKNFWPWLKENKPEEYINLTKELPPRIQQMKAKQNRTEYGDYLPYVQDFIKSDPYSSVGDFGNTGLTKVGGKYLTEAEHAELLANELKPDGMARGGAIRRNIHELQPLY